LKITSKRMMTLLNEGLSENKKGQSGDISALSCSVTRAGHISNRVWEDLKLLLGYLGIEISQKVLLCRFQ
jgi:hypothetical protein